MPPSLSSQNWQIYGRKWPLPDISSKGKKKVPQLVSWDKNILCLLEDYCGNSRIIPIPKGKQRSSRRQRLPAENLCGMSAEKGKLSVSSTVYTTTTKKTTTIQCKLPQLDQISEGLKLGGLIWTDDKVNSLAWLFIQASGTLSARAEHLLFSPRLSEQGSNRREDTPSLEPFPQWCWARFHHCGERWSWTDIDSFTGRHSCFCNRRNIVSHFGVRAARFHHLSAWWRHVSDDFHLCVASVIACAQGLWGLQSQNGIWHPQWPCFSCLETCITLYCSPHL